MHIHIKTVELPDSLRGALRCLGFRRSDISVTVSETASHLDAGGDGYRGFVAVVDLATGQLVVERGSWGGANAFEARAVDLDQRRYPIPPGKAVINGREGGNQPVSARITISPANAAALLPAAPEPLTERERWILWCYRALNSYGRKDEFERRGAPSSAELDGLAERGLLKRNRAGATRITTEGRNALETAGQRL